jgi:hypothetical protein
MSGLIDLPKRRLLKTALAGSGAGWIGWVFLMRLSLPATVASRPDPEALPSGLFETRMGSLRIDGRQEARAKRAARVTPGLEHCAIMIMP